jgi:hypothetical protein
MNNGDVVDAGLLLDRLQVPAAARPQGGYFVPAAMLADLERMTTELQNRAFLRAQFPSLYAYWIEADKHDQR